MSKRQKKNLRIYVKMSEKHETNTIFDLSVMKNNLIDRNPLRIMSRL